MKNLLFCLLTLVALSGKAYAQYSATPPLVGGTSMSLYGMGEYEDLGETIYIGALYIPQLESSIRPRSSKRMEMRIAASSLSARRFTQLWMDAITLNTSRDERVAQQSQIQRFGRLFEDTLIRGDQISFEYLQTGSQTIVLINRVQIGVIPGETFFNILLEAWIGETPLSGQFKAGILGQIEEGESVLIKRQFAEIQYSAERHRQVAGKYRSR